MKMKVTIDEKELLILLDFIDKTELAKFLDNFDMEETPK